MHFTYVGIVAHKQASKRTTTELNCKMHLNFLKETEIAIREGEALPSWFPIAAQHVAVVGMAFGGDPDAIYERIIEGKYNFATFQWADWMYHDYISQETQRRAILTAVRHGRLDILDYFAFYEEDLRFEGDKPIKMAGFFHQVHIVKYLLRYIKLDNRDRVERGEPQIPFDKHTEIPWRRMFQHFVRKKDTQSLKELVRLLM